MEITASLVKELRDLTGAGMMDCKKALAANNGDLEKSTEWLRERGIAKAVNKANRVAAEGFCEVTESGNKAVLFELNCETDFVANSDNFKKYLNEINGIILNSNVKSTEEALDLVVNGTKVSDLVLSYTAEVGEHITLRNVHVVEKNDDQVFGLYKHNGGKIAVLTVLNGGSAELAKQVAMHVAASNPRYLDQSAIPAEFIAKEREILTKEALNENAQSAKPKPEAIIAKMVEGRLNKELKEFCLVNQAFVMDPNQTVEQYVKAHGASVAQYLRVVVGEGVE